MTPTDLLPVLGGLAGGVLLALAGSSLYLRARKRTGTALIAQAATAAAETLRKSAADAEQAKAAAALEGKMEALRLREEGERELSRRRDEADRADRRAEEREKGAARRAEQIEQQEKAQGGGLQGREGRNIRAFEQATGVDLIIDDTPDTVVVSCFDPIRREIGRRALEALIVDGRIHPGRIEEIVRKIHTELEGQLVELGEEAAYETA